MFDIKEYNDTPVIFSFSANPQLSEEGNKHLNVYNQHLKAAFEEDRIHNLAITGELGIGKSSLIRSFENSYISDCENKSRFLYISLGDFKDFEFTNSTQSSNRKNINRNCLKNAGNTQINNDQQEEKKEANIVERRILLQMYARFHREDLPMSSFSLIQEECSYRKIKAVLGTVLSFFILVLVNHEQLGNLVRWTFPGDLVNNFLTHFHLFLYIITLLSLSGLMGCFLYWIIPKMNIRSLSLKSDQIEVALEEEACDSYIDKHSMELVYCLEQIAQKINFTVVFEDLDRLKSEVCIEIFERLREINYLVNLRINSKGKNVRFIYVINNHIIGSLKHYKFFDYILPVVSVMNVKSAELIFRENLKKVDTFLQEKILSDIKDKEKYFYCIEKDDTVGIVHQIIPYLIDFRKQYAVLNDYSLLFSVYYTNNSSIFQMDDAIHILAFSVYKNFWPDDYEKIAQNKSKIFPLYDPSKIRDWNNKELLKVLLESKPSFLNIKCMYYAGYRESDIRERLLSILNSDMNDDEKIQWINSLQPEDTDSLKAICLGYKDNFFINKNVEICRAVIGAALRCQYEDNSWFFQDHDIMDCLRILAGMDDKDITEFYELSGFKESGNVFQNCARIHRLENTRAWNKQELRAFCLGVKKGTINNNIAIKVEQEVNISGRINLSEELEKFWNYRKL